MEEITPNIKVTGYDKVDPNYTGKEIHEKYKEEACKLFNKEEVTANELKKFLAQVLLDILDPYIFEVVDDALIKHASDSILYNLKKLIPERELKKINITSPDPGLKEIFALIDKVQESNE